MRRNLGGGEEMMLTTGGIAHVAGVRVRLCLNLTCNVTWAYWWRQNAVGPTNFIAFARSQGPIS